VVERVIVALNGEPYTLSDFNNFARANLKREFRTEDLTRNEESKEALERFITEKLIAAEVKRLGLNVSEKNIDAYIGKVQKRNRISDADLRAALRQEGVSFEQYRASIRAEIEKGELINRQVQKKVNITSEDVKRYYTANRRKFMTKDEVHLHHFLIRIPNGAKPEHEKAMVSKALQIRELALEGEDFAQLARRDSQRASAFEGGDIGWVDRAALLTEIADVAFELSNDEISQPVRTSMGIHLVQLKARRIGKPLPLSEVEDKIRKELYAKAMEERFQKWLKSDLRKRHRVDVKLPGVVFRAEETKEGTVNSLMASESLKGSGKERGFLSYLNPLSYIVKETPVEDELGEDFSDEKTVSILGIPLFVTESAEETEEESLIQLDPEEETGKSSETDESSEGSSRSIWDKINPF
jgi:peptidyl-prolyl cis-trans isomerase SurA